MRFDRRYRTDAPPGERSAASESDSKPRAGSSGLFGTTRARTLVRAKFDLDALFEEIDFGLKGRRRGQTVFRIFSGAPGLLPGTAGAWHMHAGGVDGGLRMRATAALMLALLALFFGIDVALHAPWRRPGIGFVVCFVGMFVVRIAFGA